MTPSISRTLKFVCLSICAVLALPSCTGVLTSTAPPEQEFWLNPLESERVAVPLPHDLVILFEVEPGLDTDRLLVRGPGARASELPAAHWPDYSREYLGALLRQSLQHSGLFQRISREGQAGANNCQLSVELQQFWTTRTGASGYGEAVMGIRAWFDCAGHRDTFTRRAQTAVQGADDVAVVRAMQGSLDKVFGGLLQWQQQHYSSISEEL